MELVRQARSAVLMTAVLTVLLGLAYPLVMTGLAQALFPAQANGSLIRDGNGKAIGSSLIGQNFSDEKYFHSRPSAAGKDGYDAASSSGSNLGPTNQKLIDSVQQKSEAYRKENGLSADAPVPVDAVTTSASGLDPDISPANALLQVARVAKARGLAEERVRDLVNQHTQARVLGVLGELRVNVLDLNLALDRLR